MDNMSEELRHYIDNRSYHIIKSYIIRDKIIADPDMLSSSIDDDTGKIIRYKIKNCQLPDDVEVCGCYYTSKNILTFNRWKCQPTITMIKNHSFSSYIIIISSRYRDILKLKLKW